MRSGFGTLGVRGKKLAAAYHFFSRTDDWRRKEFECRTCKQRELHRHRNCRFFPGEWDANRKTVTWIATYKHRAKQTPRGPIPGTEDRIESTRLVECPTSFITEESKWILGEFNQAQLAHVAFGATKFGANPDRWPAWWFDAVAVLWSAKEEADRIQMTER